MNSPRVWISAEEPDETALRLAVERAGGTVAISSADADAVVWARDERGLIRDHLTECIRWVQVWDAGVDEWLSLDVVDSTRAWTCAKGLYAVPIGEYCLAALLSCARALPRQVSCSTWRPPPVASLGDWTVTVLGAGGIGRALIDRLLILGTTTIAVTRHGAAVPGATISLAVDRLEEALERSNALVIALPLTPATRGLVGRTQLELLRRGSWLVNVGRGGVVDTNALIDAIAEGRLGGAVLDVTEPEPLPDDHPLWRLRDVVITCHTAATATLGRDALVGRVEDNVARFAAGEHLTGTVDVAAGY